MNPETLIDRANEKIDPESFYQLMRVTRKQSWLEDESKALIELWNFCEYNSERELIIDLLMRFYYLTSLELKRCGIKIAEYILQEWKLQSKDTLIIAVSDKSEADGSQMFIQSIKNKFILDEWSEKNFINNIGDGERATHDNFNVVLLDDFIGTGNTIVRRINWFKKIIDKKGKKNVSIRVVCLAALEIAAPKIDLLKIEYYSPIWLKKGISDYYKDEGLKKALEDMKRLESHFAPEYRGKLLPRFGYEESEAIFTVEAFNVSNNVFPVFWWPALMNYELRNTVFRRLW